MDMRLIDHLKESTIGLLKAITPQSVKCSIKAFYIMQLIRRQSRTSKEGFCVDGDGNILPWITYPAIDFLNNIDFSHASVFEFGAGSSTQWWSAKAKSVKSVEMDHVWYKKVEKLNLPNVTIHLCDNGQNYPIFIQNYDEEFDVIIIDGAERYRSAMNAVTKLNQNGIILLDNTEWYPNTAAFLRSKKLTQIDFYGFTPFNSFPSVTSLFLNQNCDFLNMRINKEIDVIGGVRLKNGVLDDKE